MAQPSLLLRQSVVSASTYRACRGVSSTISSHVLRPRLSNTRRGVQTQACQFQRSCSSRSLSTHARARPQRAEHAPARRAYHSQFHPILPHNYTESQAAILSAALEHVTSRGFTKEALILGARDAGYLDVSVQLFSRGEFELVMYWLGSRRQLLKERVEAGLFEKVEAERGVPLSVQEKVKILVMERLRMNEPLIQQWQDALAVMALPTNIPPSLGELHTLSSEILALAGDTSVDASWYSKRLSLSTVYASAEVTMTQDSSPGFSETEAFVERRTRDNSALGNKVADVKQFLGFAASTAAGVGRSWGMKI